MNDTTLEGIIREQKAKFIQPSCDYLHLRADITIRLIERILTTTSLNENKIETILSLIVNFKN